MDIQLITEFAELARRLSITETAKALNMTQPTLSKHISQLESALHVKLFYRSHYGLRVTREGLELLNEAYNLIEAYQRFTGHAENLRVNPLPHLTVAGLTNEDAVTDFLGKAISDLSLKYGSNFLEIKSSHHQTAYELVADQSVDLAFDFVSKEDFEDDENVEVICVEKLRWYAVVNPTSSLFQKESISISDLNGQTLLKMEGNHIASSWAKFEKLLDKYNVSPQFKRQYTMKMVDLISACATLGSDVLILAKNFTDRVIPMSSQHIKAIPFVEEDAFLPLSAMYHKENQNPVLKGLLENI